MRKACVFLIALAVAACSTAPVSSPRLASSRGVGLGPQRLVVEFYDRSTSAPVTVPEGVVATLRTREGSPLSSSEGEFLWLVPDERGAFVFRVDVPEAGTYQLTFAAGDHRFGGPLGFEALESRPVIEIGEAAPASRTRTSFDHPLERISSDAQPDPSFYDTSVHEAVAAGTSVLVFGSPGHCLTASCATVLDLVKTVAQDFREVDFVHVETVEDPGAGSGSTSAHVEAVAEWGLVVEPTVFVVVDGVVTAYFEVALTAGELRRALGSGGG